MIRIVAHSFVHQSIDANQSKIDAKTDGSVQISKDDSVPPGGGSEPGVTVGFCAIFFLSKLAFWA